MAGTLISTLYPPVPRSTFATAFVVNTAARVYFSISSFNSAGDIKRVHYSVVNQKTNENVLNSGTGLMVSDGLNYDESVGFYYIDISADSILKTTAGNGKATGWNHNMIYAVQLRFDNSTDSWANTNEYFSTHLANFSEWSSVVLLRPIAQPILVVRPWDMGKQTEDPNFNPGIVPITGSVVFNDADLPQKETETVQYFQIQVTQRDKNKVLLDSGKLYTANSLNRNQLNYLLDVNQLDTEDVTSYDIYIKFVTKNQYSKTRKYKFTISEFVENMDFSPKITVKMDNENAIATVNVKNETSVIGTLYIKRASSLSNFKKWETIYASKVNSTLDISIEDNTVGSGVWYQYYTQLQGVGVGAAYQGPMSKMYKSSKIFPEFYDAVISRQDKQISLRFNYTVSGLKPTVNRQKVDTLGGQYPKFAENAILNYKQFSIQGLISTQEDAGEKFLSKRKFYGDNYNNFLVHEDKFYRDEYLKENYNFLWEREFREELTKWLNDGEPKLYRSMTEGLMVVMLTDITLTPNETLGRRLYTFSATCYEIADGDSLDTLNSLGVYRVITPTMGVNGESPDPMPDYVNVSKPGQLYHIASAGLLKGDIIGKKIFNDCKTRYSGVLSTKQPQNARLRNVKIWFHSRPHVFYVAADGSLELIARDNKTTPWTQTDTNRYKNKQLILGYRFDINALRQKKNSNAEDSSIPVTGDRGKADLLPEASLKSVFVNERGFYQVPNDIEVNDIEFPQTDDEVTMEYVLDYEEHGQRAGQVTSTTVQKIVVGQQRDIFRPGVFQDERIMRRYYYIVKTKNQSFFQRMKWWKGYCFDVQPYSLLRVQEHGKTEYQDIEIGGTGVFHILKDMEIDDFCFLGRRMKRVDESRLNFCDEWEYVLDTSVIGDIVDETWHTVSGIDTKESVEVYDNDSKYAGIIDTFKAIPHKLSDKEQQTSDQAKLEAIENPKIHMVYQVNGRNYLYYIDNQFYEIELDEGYSEGLAKVPVTGNFDFYGMVYRNTML